MYVKKKIYSGYILLDSLVALSCFSLFAFTYLNWGAQLQKKQQEQTIRLEAFRSLYEISELQKQKVSPTIYKTVENKEMIAYGNEEKVLVEVREEHFEIRQLDK